MRELTIMLAQNLGKLQSVALLLAWCLAACATATPSSPTPVPTAALAKVRFEIVDEDTGTPMAATITVRRELTDGSLETRTFKGQRFEMDVPVDALLDVQVQAEGYHDWNVKMKIKKTATLSGPIRLKRLAQPSPQGEERNGHKRFA